MAANNTKWNIDFTRLFDIAAYQKEKFPNAKALNEFKNGKWHPVSVSKVIERAQALAFWFINNSYRKGDTLLIVPHGGTPDWIIIDLAAQQAGLVVVPVHPSAREPEIETIVQETQPRLAITASEELARKLKGALPAANMMDISHLEEGSDGYWDAIRFTTFDNEMLTAVDASAASIREDDLVTIMYTSGSSGIPKGVMLTHRNIVAGIKGILPLFPLEPGQRVLSFLPFSHIFERVACYGFMAFGASVYFNRDKNSLASDFKTARPHFCTSVPRVLEKMYDIMQEQSLMLRFPGRQLIRWAMKVGMKYKAGGRGILYGLQLWVARLLVLSKWRKKLGGKIKYMVVGAASLRPEIGRLFSAGGINVAEGYGMTETAPFISVNRFEPGMNRFGTVGMPIPGVEVRIDNPNEAGEGEILVRGANVMKGYFNKPDANAQAFTSDGWFRTGDIGKMVYQRFLQITDRKKDIFKTSTGKYIAPQPLQNHFMTSPLIQRCLILGFQQAFVTALVVPNFELLEAWCAENNIHWTAPEYMVYNIRVREKIQHEINRLNDSLPGYQRVRDFVLCHQDWSVEAGELTTTLKPVRHLLMEHYQKEIDKMYAS